jgi:hypothetical protein
LQGTDAELLVIRYGHGDRGVGGALLHHDVAPLAADLLKSM